MLTRNIILYTSVSNDPYNVHLYTAVYQSKHTNITSIINSLKINPLILVNNNKCCLEIRENILPSHYID